MFKIKGFANMLINYIFSLCIRENVIRSALHSSISELTRKPTVEDFPMKEGQAATLTCIPYHLCSDKAKIHWKWTKADGQSTVQHDYDFDFFSRIRVMSIFHLTPTADDHNTNITCVHHCNS